MVSGTEAARVHPGNGSEAVAHDAFTRLLHRLEPDPEALWEEARSQVQRRRGVLVLDDTILDKPYARAQRNHIGLAIRAFVRLEMHRIATGMSWVEAKLSIIRDAIRAYLANPTFTLGGTA